MASIIRGTTPTIKYTFTEIDPADLTAAVCSVGYWLFLGPDRFLIPTLVTCLAALLLLRGPIEKKEGTVHE